MDFDKIASALNVAPNVFFAIAVASGVVLFVPPSVQATLGVDALLVTYRMWVGGAFILSLSIFLSAMGSRLFRYVGPVFVEKWNDRQRRKELAVLSPPEKKLLAAYIRNNTTTLPQFYGDGVANGLVAKKVLYWAAQIGHPGSHSFDCNLQPWAWRELKRDPSVLNLETDHCADDV